MKQSDRILSIIRSGIKHIADEQRPDGGFTSLSSFRTDDFSEAIPYATTFFASNILSCLHGIRETDAIQNRAARFLRSEKSERGSWNYWGRTAKERKTLPYPDDLDDTFAALAALVAYDPRLIGGETLSDVAKLLAALEVKEGGPYRTWIIRGGAAEKWQDVDVVVNSTIGYFLSLIGIRLPNVNRFIDDAIREGRLTSPYYPGIFQASYFISRFYKGTLREKWAKAIAPCIVAPDRQMAPLERAMAITSLLNLGCGGMVSTDNVMVLATEIEQAGWRPYAFCIDPAREGKTSYAGSSALTAAFCIETLSRWMSWEEKMVCQSPRAPESELIYEHIRELARAECAEVSPVLRGMAFTEIEKISDQKITLLAYEFAKVLATKGKMIPEATIEQLSLGNLYGWMAYAIYDDLLDGEGDPRFIPCANLFLRRLAAIYGTLNAHIPGVQELFNEIMDTIEAANAWEQEYCRIPAASRLLLPEKLPYFGEYENLADRSIGHAMGPFAELLATGVGTNSEEFGTIASFFRHYLIARQLHDDAHDWADDLLRGQINSVGALVIRNFQSQEEGFATEGGGASVAESLPRLRRLFWQEVVDAVVGEIRAHIAAARRARESSALLKNTFFMENTIAALHEAAERTLRERDETLIFLDRYARI